MDIKDYEQEAAKDFTIDITSINSYCLRIGYIQAKWAKYVYLEEQILNDIESELTTIYKDRFYHYSYNSPEKIDKKNIDTFVFGDSEYQEKKREFNAQKNLVKYINSVLSALGNQSFYLNTCVKHLEWQSGK